MALRLIEMVLQKKPDTKIFELLKEYKTLELRQIQLPDGQVLLRILLDAEQSESVLDLLEKRYIGQDGNRVVILPVEATLPRADPEEKPDVTTEQLPLEKKPPERISREELYEDIKNAARCSRVYLAMVVLSTIVAIVGLYQNSIAIIIGAMVIAPHLGPNVALALATTLGDLPLAKRALLTNLSGIAMTVVLSIIIGTLVHVNPTLSEISSHTRVGLSDIIIALASGCAGVLAFTAGISTTLVGVMVAVSLLPPLVISGLLLGSGQLTLAMGSLSLFLVNLICVNLAGVTTFLAQGIQPTTWWEKNLAAKASRIAILMWLVFSAVLAILILLLQKR